MSFFETIKRIFGFGSSKSLKQSGSVPRDDYAYNEMKKEEEKKMDKILDKIAAKGIDSLTQREKSFLDSKSKQS